LPNTRIAGKKDREREKNRSILFRGRKLRQAAEEDEEGIILKSCWTHKQQLEASEGGRED
jgi:hypothetical protein